MQKEPTTFWERNHENNPKLLNPKPFEKNSTPAGADPQSKPCAPGKAGWLEERVGTHIHTHTLPPSLPLALSCPLSLPPPASPCLSLIMNLMWTVRALCVARSEQLLNTNRTETRSAQRPGGKRRDLRGAIRGVEQLMAQACRFAGRLHEGPHPDWRSVILNE